MSCSNPVSFCFLRRSPHNLLTSFTLDLIELQDVPLFHLIPHPVQIPLCRVCLVCSSKRKKVSTIAHWEGYAVIMEVKELTLKLAHRCYGKDLREVLNNKTFNKLAAKSAGIAYLLVFVNRLAYLSCSEVTIKISSMPIFLASTSKSTPWSEIFVCASGTR